MKYYYNLLIPIFENILALSFFILSTDPHFRGSIVETLEEGVSSTIQ